MAPSMRTMLTPILLLAIAAVAPAASADVLWTEDCTHWGTSCQVICPVGGPGLCATPVAICIAEKDFACDYAGYENCVAVEPHTDYVCFRFPNAT